MMSQASSQFLFLALGILVVTFVITIAMSSKVIATTDVLFFVIIAISLIILSMQRETSREEFVDTPFPKTITKVGTNTSDEVTSISQQTWNETLSVEPLFADLTHYYTVYSKTSIDSLLASPSSWVNLINPTQKIVFNKIDWPGGLGTGINFGGGIRGIGPASMSLGIPFSTNQAFTFFYVCKYNSNPLDITQMKVISTFANTITNNGISMEFDAKKDNSLNTYQITPRMKIADKEADIEPFYVNTQNLYIHMISISRGSGAFVAKYTIMTLDENNISYSESNKTIAITEPIFFSNRNIEIGDTDATKASPLNLCCVGVLKRAVTTKEMNDVAKYFQGVTLKLSNLALNLYSLYGEVTACPYDKQTCDACVNVNLANPNNILLASTECKKQLDTYCSAHPNQMGCECYKSENKTQPYCGYWKKILQGAPTLCSVGEQLSVAPPTLLQASTPAEATTTCPVIEVMPIAKPQTTFWEKMAQILGYRKASNLVSTATCVVKTESSVGGTQIPK